MGPSDVDVDVWNAKLCGLLTKSRRSPLLKCWGRALSSGLPEYVHSELTSAVLCESARETKLALYTCLHYILLVRRRVNKGGGGVHHMRRDSVWQRLCTVLLERLPNLPENYHQTGMEAGDVTNLQLLLRCAATLFIEPWASKQLTNDHFHAFVNLLERSEREAMLVGVQAELCQLLVELSKRTRASHQLLRKRRALLRPVRSWLYAKVDMVKGWLTGTASIITAKYHRQWSVHIGSEHDERTSSVLPLLVLRLLACVLINDSTEDEDLSPMLNAVAKICALLDEAFTIHGDLVLGAVLRVLSRAAYNRAAVQDAMADKGSQQLIVGMRGLLCSKTWRHNSALFVCWANLVRNLTHKNHGAAIHFTNAGGQELLQVMLPCVRSPYSVTCVSRAARNLLRLVDEPVAGRLLPAIQNLCKALMPPDASPAHEILPLVRSIEDELAVLFQRALSEPTVDRRRACANQSTASVAAAGGFPLLSSKFLAQHPGLELWEKAAEAFALMVQDRAIAVETVANASDYAGLLRSYNVGISLRRRLLTLASACVKSAGGGLPSASAAARVSMPAAEDSEDIDDECMYALSTPAYLVAYGMRPSAKEASKKLTRMLQDRWLRTCFEELCGCLWVQPPLAANLVCYCAAQLEEQNSATVLLKMLPNLLDRNGVGLTSREALATHTAALALFFRPPLVVYLSKVLTVQLGVDEDEKVDGIDVFDTLQRTLWMWSWRAKPLRFQLRRVAFAVTGTGCCTA
jgi:hypothetical protein